MNNSIYRYSIGEIVVIVNNPDDPLDKGSVCKVIGYDGRHMLVTKFNTEDDLPYYYSKTKFRLATKLDMVLL